MDAAWIKGHSVSAASMLLREEHSLMIGHVHSIESSGIMDGPGIRMVTFLSGCPMRYLYYHNPDIRGPKGGTPVTAEDILNQYGQARPLYRKGDITVGGDKPLVQIGFVIELFEKVKKRSIHTCLDTSGTTFNLDSQVVMAHFGRFLASIDLMLLDIKHIDPEEHVKLCSQPQDNILASAGYPEKKQIPVWVCHVVVPGIMDREEYLYRLGHYLGMPKDVKALDVLPYHGMGKAKYHRPGTPYPLEDTAPLPPVKAAEARKTILQGVRDERTHCS